MSKLQLKAVASVLALLLASAAPAHAGGGDSFSGPEPAAEDGYRNSERRTLYERIYDRYAHYGHDVEEEFRDGPCRVTRRWERDGDFEERVSCEGPRH